MQIEILSYRNYPNLDYLYPVLSKLQGQASHSVNWGMRLMCTCAMQPLLMTFVLLIMMALNSFEENYKLKYKVSYSLIIKGIK